MRKLVSLFLPLLFVLLFAGRVSAQPSGIPGTSGQLLGVGATPTTPLVAGNLTGDCSSSAFTTTCTKINNVPVALGGAFTLSGANPLTLTTTGTTNVTLPTSGTLLTTTGSGAGLTGITYPQLPALSANQVLGALTATTPSGLSVPSCSTTASALQFTSGTGFACNTALVVPAVTLTGTNLSTTVITSNLAAVGTLSTGVWSATAIGAQWGGTGQNFSSSTGIPSLSSGVWAVSTTPTLTATNVTGIPPHQISTSLLCTSNTGAASSTAYTCTTNPSFTPVSGDQILWATGANDTPNTGIAPTLAVNGATAAPIKKNSAALPLNPGDVGNIKSTSKYYLTFDGTSWQLGSQTANNLSTYNNAPNDALSAFYACLSNSDTNVCRAMYNADSEVTCWLTSTCAFGPQHEQNLSPVALLTLLQKRGYPIYSTGVIGPISVVSTSSLFSNGILPGITCTGTVTQVSLSGVGPQQATGALTGGGTLQMASGAVCTVAVSTFVATANGTAGAFNRFKVYCAINSTTGTMTVTISGQTASTACTGTNASPLAQAFTVTNSAGTTALSVAITCTTGTCNLGGYEEIFTTANNGFAIDGFDAAGGANSYWLGGATGNAAYLKLTTGTVGLLINAIGINDAAGSIASSTVTANIATFVANWPAASVLVWSSFPYTGTGSANYPAIQAAEQAYALANFYDFLNTVDNASSNTSVNYWAGIENSDTTHPTDMGASANFAQLWIHLFGSEAQSALTLGSVLTSNNNGYLAFLNGQDTNSIAESLICYATTVTFCGGRRVVSAQNATFSAAWMDGVTGGAAQTTANGAVANTGSYLLGYSTTAGTQTPAIANTALHCDPTTGLCYMPLNRVPLTAAQTFATTTAANVTGWAWAMLSGQTMIVECDGMYQAASTGGLRFAATGPAMTGFQLSLSMGLNSTAASMATPPSVTATSTLTGAIAVTTATTNYPFHLYIYANASAAGTLQIQSASAAAVNSIIGIGSSCVVR